MWRRGMVTVSSPRIPAATTAAAAADAAGRANARPEDDEPAPTMALGPAGALRRRFAGGAVASAEPENQDAGTSSWATSTPKAMPTRSSFWCAACSVEKRKCCTRMLRASSSSFQLWQPGESRVGCRPPSSTSRVIYMQFWRTYPGGDLSSSGTRGGYKKTAFRAAPARGGALLGEGASVDEVARVRGLGGHGERGRALRARDGAASRASVRPAAGGRARRARDGVARWAGDGAAGDGAGCPAEGRGRRGRRVASAGSANIGAT